MGDVSPTAWALAPVTFGGSLLVEKGLNKLGDMARPKLPPLPGMPENPTDNTETIRAARLMERRRQLGLRGRQSSWLTGARGDSTEPVLATKTLLGG